MLNVISYMLDSWYWVLGTRYWACQVKCDACPACPAGKNDRVGVKFELQNHFIREGAYFTGVLLFFQLVGRTEVV